MSIESELQAQVDFLKRDTTKWVQCYPIAFNEACMVVRASSSSPRHISVLATEWISRWMISIGLMVESVTVWNDKLAQSKQEVIAMLEKAIAVAGEKGV